MNISIVRAQVIAVVLIYVLTLYVSFRDVLDKAFYQWKECHVVYIIVLATVSDPAQDAVVSLQNIELLLEIVNDHTT